MFARPSTNPPRSRYSQGHIARLVVITAKQVSHYGLTPLRYFEEIKIALKSKSFPVTVIHGRLVAKHVETGNNALAECPCSVFVEDTILVSSGSVNWRLSLYTATKQ